MNELKLVQLTFKSWGDIHYYNKFTRACRVQETTAKMSYLFKEENKEYETFIILN